MYIYIYMYRYICILYMRRLWNRRFPCLISVCFSPQSMGRRAYGEVLWPPLLPCFLASLLRTGPIPSATSQKHIGVGPQECGRPPLHAWNPPKPGDKRTEDGS